MEYEDYVVVEFLEDKSVYIVAINWLTIIEGVLISLLLFV